MTTPLNSSDYKGVYSYVALSLLTSTAVNGNVIYVIRHLIHLNTCARDFS